MQRVLYLCFFVWLLIQCTIQQDSGDDGDDDDTCSYISGQNCDNNGICKYCAMCLQSSCILSKSIPSNKSGPVCNTTLFGSTDIYDWYGYCLSSGNDNSGDYCATSTECYQYRRNSNASTSYIWQNLTCDPNSCLLITDNGQPAPTPGALPPPVDNPSASSNHNNPTESHSLTPEPARHEPQEHNATAIALSVTCTLIFVGILGWLFRLWKRSRYWPSFKQPVRLTCSTPNSAPPSFRSTAATAAVPEMTCITDRPSSTRSSSGSSNSRGGGEPLPSYFSPDPSPPKYEHAIVTQIRGLLEDGNYQYQASSSTDHQSGALPPPMWVPIYFTPNHTSFSLGRLRRHPHYQSASPNGDQPASSSSSNEQDLGSSSAFSSTEQQQQHTHDQ
ncbi:hypothetical protein BC941DRAFT_413284 [Chlamydoabsidia padenii]|nr:hypothetical protein BC941DRAFT_413284 [Chlamydoabsidia padenii]